MEHKWIKYMRALPSYLSESDVLKSDYIDVNLRNLRALIQNLNDLGFVEAHSGSGESPERQIVLEMLPLHQVKEEMSWLE